MILVHFIVGLFIFALGLFITAYLLSALGIEYQRMMRFLLGTLAICIHYARQGILELIALITKKDKWIQLAKVYRRNRKYKIINKCHRFIEATCVVQMCPHCKVLVPVPSNGLCINCKKYLDEEEQLIKDARNNIDIDAVLNRRIKYIEDNMTEEE